MDQVTIGNGFCKKGLKHQGKLLQKIETGTSYRVAVLSPVYSLQLCRSLKHGIIVLSSVPHKYSL